MMLFVNDQCVEVPVWMLSNTELLNEYRWYIAFELCPLEDSELRLKVIKTEMLIRKSPNNVVRFYQ